MEYLHLNTFIRNTFRDSFQSFTSIENSNGLLTDIYNGEIWNKYQVINGIPLEYLFLEYLLITLH